MCAPCGPCAVSLPSWHTGITSLSTFRCALCKWTVQAITGSFPGTAQAWSTSLRTLDLRGNTLTAGTTDLLSRLAIYNLVEVDVSHLLALGLHYHHYAYAMATYCKHVQLRGIQMHSWSITSPKTLIACSPSSQKSMLWLYHPNLTLN
jgi:hypothetical protein